VDQLESRHRPVAFSLLSDAGRKLLAGDALLSQSVLETRYSPNRRGPVAIVGIIVVQSATVPRVADTHIVGVASVGSAEQPASPGATYSLLPIMIRF